MGCSVLNNILTSQNCWCIAPKKYIYPQIPDLHTIKVDMRVCLFVHANTRLKDPIASTLLHHCTQTWRSVVVEIMCTLFVILILMDNTLSKIQMNIRTRTLCYIEIYNSITRVHLKLFQPNVCFCLSGEILHWWRLMLPSQQATSYLVRERCTEFTQVMFLKVTPTIINPMFRGLVCTLQSFIYLQSILV